MKNSALFLLLLLSSACALLAQAATTPPILEARRGFETNVLRKEAVGEAPDQPPAGVLKLVTYPSPLGRNAAYVSPSPADGKKHPVIIWLTGGFSNSIGSIAWTPGPVSNDQSASGFRQEGILMMYPSLRGGNNNPGYIETFYGEVDDVLAAAKALASLDYVDPKRIYLGGHSTGGTLALLVAAAGGDRFRAVFALGPVDNVVGYGADVLPFDLKNPKEAQVRAPVVWISSITCPTYIFEGTKAPSNLASLQALQTRPKIKNPRLHFIPVDGESHFSAIFPVVAQISHNIIADEPSSADFNWSKP